MSSKFFQNKECEYFPCHRVTQEQKAKFNCMFCYCPLHHKENCGGCHDILENGWKDCKNCTIPHFDYDYIIKKLMD